VAFKNARNHKMKCWDKYGSKPNKKGLKSTVPKNHILSNQLLSTKGTVKTHLLKGILDSEKPFSDLLQFYSCHYLLVLLFSLFV
jgi:hypothetical protein